jgi:GNAT superfamily N-acetyltransferase
MVIVIREVSSRQELKTFIYLPSEIHKNHANWVPPIYMDEWIYFDPEKNKAFRDCDHIFLLAWNESKAVGRIMGLISHKYNEIKGENNGRFAWMETYNDPKIAKALLEAVENWARERGMQKLVGPLAFSDKDPQGMLIEGFDKPVVVASNCNFPYQSQLLENEGFSKEVDLVVYQIPVPEQIPGFYQKINERFSQKNGELKLMEFTSRRKVRPFIRPVFHLVNNTFHEIYGFVPYTEDEMDDIANRYLYLINPRFIKIVVNATMDPVAFVIGMADISKGIQKCRGKLIPLGIFRVILAARKSKQLNLLLGAIAPDYRGRGLDVMMGIKMLESARKKGKLTIDSHLELESNHKVRAEMEKLGGKVYKRYRIFQKQL